MKRLFGLYAAAVVLALVGLMIWPADKASAGAGLPHCADTRHDYEGKFFDPAKSPNTEILCVCAANASGCPAIPYGSCQAATGTNSYKRQVAINDGLQACVYNLGQVDHPAWQNNGQLPAYWAQRILNANGLPHCMDSRHDYEGTFLDTTQSPNTETLCVCAANASGCSAITASSCMSKAYWRITTLPNGAAVCVYNLGQIDHPAYKGKGVQRAYWAQRITGPIPPPQSSTITCPAPSDVTVNAPTGWQGHNPTTFIGISTTGGQTGIACSYGVTGQSVINIRISMSCPTGKTAAVTGANTAACN